MRCEQGVCAVTDVAHTRLYSPALCSHRPSNWKGNTAVCFVAIGAITYGLFSLSAEREVSPRGTWCLGSITSEDAMFLFADRPGPLRLQLLTADPHPPLPPLPSVSRHSTHRLLHLTPHIPILLRHPSTSSHLPPPSPSSSPRPRPAHTKIVPPQAPHEVDPEHALGEAVHLGRDGRQGAIGCERRAAQPRAKRSGEQGGGGAFAAGGMLGGRELEGVPAEVQSTVDGLSAVVHPR